MDLQLTGKRAIVSGGSRGIGKAVARELAREGCDVVLLARGEAQLRATAAELAAETGRKFTPIVCDASQDESVQAAIREAIAALGGGVDILVNCAATPGGTTPPPMLADINDDNFWPDMNVKVLGYLRTARVQTTARFAGEFLFHLEGVAREVRNQLMVNSSATDYTPLDWLYAHGK